MAVSFEEAQQTWQYLRRYVPCPKEQDRYFMLCNYFANPPSPPTDEAKAAALEALQNFLLTPAKHEERRRVLGEIANELKLVGEYSDRGQPPWLFTLSQNGNCRLSNPDMQLHYDLDEFIDTMQTIVAKCRAEEAERAEWMIQLARKLQEQYAPFAPVGTIPGMAAVIAEEFEAQKKREGGTS
jgi:hypothetical protein